MTPFAVIAALGLASVAAAQEADPVISRGILLDRLPLAPQARPGAEAYRPPLPAAPAESSPGPSGLAFEFLPGTTVAPRFLDPGRNDAAVDGPAGRDGDRRLGDRLLDSGPGIVLQRPF